jgi:hypothetical protein
MPWSDMHMRSCLPNPTSTRPPGCFSSRASGRILMKLDIRRHYVELYGLFDFLKDEHSRTRFLHKGAYVYYTVVCNRKAAKKALGNYVYFGTDFTVRVLFSLKFRMLIYLSFAQYCVWGITVVCIPSRQRLFINLMLVKWQYLVPYLQSTAYFRQQVIVRW